MWFFLISKECILYYYDMIVILLMNEMVLYLIGCCWMFCVFDIERVILRIIEIGCGVWV